MRMRNLFLAATILAGSVGAYAMTAEANDPVRIAAIAPLSGPGAFDGKLAVEGMEAMAAIINENGGVLGGREIELVIYDDKGNPEEGVSATKRAIEQDDVDIIVGGWFSSVALTMKEVTRDRILNIMTTSQHPNTTKEGHQYLFRLNATSNMMATTYSQFICDEMEIGSIAFLTINDDWGRLEVDNYTKLLGECDITVAGNEFYNREDTDFTTALTKLKALDTDAIFVSAINTAQGATIYRQLRQVGYQGTTVASAGNMNPKLVELSGPALEGVYSVSLFAPDSTDPELIAWMEKYGELFDNEPSFIGSIGAQAVEVLAEAIDKVGDARDYDALSATLRDNGWDTLLGDITFDEIGQAMQNIYLIQVVDGEITSAGR